VNAGSEDGNCDRCISDGVGASKRGPFGKRFVVVVVSFALRVLRIGSKRAPGGMKDPLLLMDLVEEGWIVFE